MPFNIRFGGSSGTSTPGSSSSGGGGGWWSRNAPNLIAAGSNILGGLIGSSGVRAANESNLEIARENRAWQERMSNTAYQRAALDLENAGLNRILALGSPATTPGGNVATFQNEKAPLGEGVSNAVSTALQARRLRQELRNMQAQERLTRRQADAIAPASQAGRALDKVVDKVENVDWKSMRDQAGRDFDAARTAVKRVAKSLNLKVERVQQLLIEAASEMDVPPGMTNKELLIWAVKNIEKVRAYLNRKNNFRSTK